MIKTFSVFQAKKKEVEVKVHKQILSLFSFLFSRVVLLLISEEETYEEFDSLAERSFHHDDDDDFPKLRGERISRHSGS